MDDAAGAGGQASGEGFSSSFVGVDQDAVAGGRGEADRRGTVEWLFASRPGQDEILDHNIRGWLLGQERFDVAIGTYTVKLGQKQGQSLADDGVVVDDRGVRCALASVMAW